MDVDANARPVAGEREGLLGFLAQQRRVLKITAYGLTEEQVEEYGAGFRLTPDDTLGSLLTAYDEVAAYTEQAVAGIGDLGRPVPVPDEPWFPSDVEAWSVRWVLLHLIEETARHAGHADVVRESIDGATAYELMAAAERWEPSPWLKPWELAVSA